MKMSDKEMLENMSPIGFDLDGNILLKGVDYFWLIEQAERAQELESELNKQIEIGYKFEGEVYDLAKENKRYREALEFYADESNNEWDVDYYGNIEYSEVMIDGGQKARQALEGEE